MTRLEPDLCIIGAGSAGLSLAAGAAQLGADVVLIEKGAMGGDCLNVGCVPSKSLIAAAHRAAAFRDSRAFGVNAAEPEIDAAAVRGHVEGVIAEIAPHDSVERFEGLGVKVLRTAAAFTGPDTVQAGGHAIKAKRFAIATGSRPAVPPVLADVPHLTNETFFGVAPAFEHLLILGGGAIGCEMAQACRRLGVAVTLVTQGPILGRDDPDLAALVRQAFVREGVDLIEHAKVLRAEPGPALVVAPENGGVECRVEGSHLLVATGRRPVVEGLGLDVAGIGHDERGIKVDRHLRTSNRRAYALGDCKGAPMFTHAAGHEAGVVLQNVLFRLPAKAQHRLNPRATYTDPELAQVGLTEAEARARHGGAVQVLTWKLKENDRARAERAAGLAKIVLDGKGRLLGAGIAAPGAGDLIVPWQLVLAGKASLKDIAQLTMPYPTLSEVSKRAAGSYFAPKLFGDLSRRAVGLLARLP